MIEHYYLRRIRQAIREGDYYLTLHAEQERDTDAITIAELEEAFGSDEVEVVEEYPDDPRGNSLLALGFTKSRLPLHAVIGLAGAEVVFITIYRPNREKWYDWRRRI